MAPAVLSAKPHVRIADENGPAVVAVNILHKKGTSTGTGFIVGADGLIATNKHVVADAAYINITLNTGKTSGEAKIVAVHPVADLALLKITAANLPTVTFGDSDYARPGSRITVIGNPRRLQNTVSDGLISQVRLVGKSLVMQQISAPISPSSSGSPVFNRDGLVISIATSTFAGEDNQNLNFAVPVNYLKELMLSKNYTLPLPKEEKKVSIWSRVVSYLRRCWEILMRLF